MKVKRLLSAAIALTMTAGMIVIPQMNASAETYSFSTENGWTLAAATDNGNGSLTITGSGGATFTPELEGGKTYTISYNVSGLVTVEDDGYTDNWAYPFRVLTNEENWDDPLLAYRMEVGGRWNYGKSDGLVTNGTNGSNSIVIDTENMTITGYALGSMSKTETINDLNGFNIKFFGWASPYATISNFSMTEQAEDTEDPTPEPSSESYYYNDDFENTTADKWWSTYKIDSEVEGKVTYAWGTEFYTELNGNHAIKKTSGDIYIFNSTPLSDIYIARFDIKPAAVTAAANTKVFRMDIGARWVEAENVILSSDSSGNVNTLTFFGEIMTIDPNKWVTIEIVRDFSNNPNTITAKATQGDNILKGTRETDASYRKLSMDINSSGFAGVLFDNITVKDYEPEDEEPEPFTGVYYAQDFDKISSDFEAWRTSNAYTPSASQPFQMWRGSLLSDSDGQYVLSGALDIYPLAVTPRTDKYKLSFDIKPNAATFANGTNWEAIVMQFNLGSTKTDSWHDMKIGSSAGASKQGQVDIDTLWIFGNSMTIDPNKWVNIELTYDCNSELIIAAATQGSSSTSGTASFKNDVSSSTSSPKIVFEALTVNDVQYGGICLDNVVIAADGEDRAPVLTADDIKLYDGDTEQSFASASVFTDTVTVDFGQEMWPDDMTAEKIYVIDQSSGEKITGGKYSFSNKQLTVRYPDGFAAGGTYTVKIEEVRNIGGVYTSEEYSKDFALAGGVSARLMNITQNNKSVNNMNSLSAGAAKINLKYANTRDSSPMLHIVIGYYKSGELAAAEYIKSTAVQTERSINYSVDCAISSVVGGCDEVQLMLLDSFDSIKPLSAPVTIK